MYTHYAVGVPSKIFSQHEFQRLLDIITYNASQLTEALGTENLIIVHLKERLWFPWFTSKGTYGEIKRYHYLVHGLCTLAQEYHCQISKPEIRQEVRFLLRESGFSIKAEGFSIFNIRIAWKNWCNRMIRALSDIHTCFFGRVE